MEFSAQIKQVVAKASKTGVLFGLAFEARLGMQQAAQLLALMDSRVQVNIVDPQIRLEDAPAYEQPSLFDGATAADEAPAPPFSGVCPNSATVEFQFDVNEKGEPEPGGAERTSAYVCVGHALVMRAKIGPENVILEKEWPEMEREGRLCEWVITAADEPVPEVAPASEEADVQDAQSEADVQDGDALASEPTPEPNGRHVAGDEASWEFCRCSHMRAVHQAAANMEDTEGACQVKLCSCPAFRAADGPFEQPPPEPAPEPQTKKRRRRGSVEEEYAAVYGDAKGQQVA